MPSSLQINHVRYRIDLGRVMRKGPGRHDKWFRVICIWNHLVKMAAITGFKEYFYGFNCYFQTFITSIMLFRRWSGQKSFKLKLEKYVVRALFAWRGPNILLFFEFGPAARYIKLYKAIGREGYLLTKRKLSIEWTGLFCWNCWLILDLVHLFGTGFLLYIKGRTCVNDFFYRAGVFTAWRSTGRCPVSHAIQIMC